MSRRRVPLHRSPPAGRELEYVSQVIASGKTGGGGDFLSRCERLLASALGAPRVVLTTSGTHALELAAMLLALTQDDEVIVPSFTFSSTVLAFLRQGARPRFVDIRPDTLCIDERIVPEAITSRTKAIVPVHYGGVPGALDVLREVAASHAIPLVEDSAYGLFGRYRGRPVGCWGELGMVSFHATKSFSCGEGGALIINDERLAARAEVLREMGTDRSRQRGGESSEYSWVDTGSSYLPSELNCAYLYAQLEAREPALRRKRELFGRYRRDLSSWAGVEGMMLPQVGPSCDPVHGLFFVIAPDEATRHALSVHLSQRGIENAPHYRALHDTPMGRRLGGRRGDCPVAESVAARILRLPFFAELSEGEYRRVISAVTAFRVARSRKTREGAVA